MTTIAKADFDKLPKEAQASMIDAGVTVTDSNVVDPFAEAVSEPTATNDYEIDGDAVFLNVTVNINGHKLRLKGVKLTQKIMCLDGYDKSSKTYNSEHDDTMNLIRAVRKHGSDKVNEAMEITATVGMAGEKHGAGEIDLLA